MVVVHGTDIVGLPTQAVKESRERVQAVSKNSGLPYPRKRIIVYLATAAIRKEGPAYDLPHCARCFADADARSFR